MRDVLVLISFDTVQFITAIKVRGNHKIVSNIWNPCCAAHLQTTSHSSTLSGFQGSKEMMWRN